MFRAFEKAVDSETAAIRDVAVELVKTRWGLWYLQLEPKNLSLLCPREI